MSNRPSAVVTRNNRPFAKVSIGDVSHAGTSGGAKGSEAFNRASSAGPRPTLWLVAFVFALAMAAALYHSGTPQASPPQAQAS